MALYVNGNKVFNSLVVDGDRGSESYTDILSNETLIPNVYIDKNNGSQVGYNTWSATDYIDVEGITDLYLCSSATSAADREYNAWYDSNKTFIGNFWLVPHITVPSTARYMRMSAKTENITGSKLFCSE